MNDHQGIGSTIQLKDRRIKFQTPVLSRKISRMPPQELDDAAKKLHGLIADYCGYLAETLYMDSELQEKLFARLQEARKEIDLSEDPVARKLALNEAIFEVTGFM